MGRSLLLLTSDSRAESPVGTSEYELVVEREVAAMSVDSSRRVTSEGDADKDDD